MGGEAAELHWSERCLRKYWVKKSNMKVPQSVLVIYMYSIYCMLCSLPQLINILSFFLSYFRINIEENLQMTKQQASKLLDDQHTQVSTTELGESETLKAV